MSEKIEVLEGSSSSSNSNSRVVYEHTATVLSKPTPKEIITEMALLAKFLNQLAAESLRSEVLSASNPAVAALFNASTQLESGGIALHQILQQQQTQGIAVPGQGPAGQGGPGPRRLQ